MNNNQDKTILEKHNSKIWQEIPKNFEQAISVIKEFAFTEVKKEAEKKQLYFHNHAHAEAVQRRAEIIFNAIKPFWNQICYQSDSSDSKRAKYLIDICAASHDMIQEFLPLKSPQTARQRESGVSENATINKLIEFIKHLNQKYTLENPELPALFTQSDLEIIRKSISATICYFDTNDNSIYQPDLYNSEEQILLNARIIALADIGGLGIDGIAAYFQEGSLILLEENPDIIPLIKEFLTKKEDSSNNKEVYENLRERLLKRAKFQISFAKGRLARLNRELEGLPEEVVLILKEKVFKHLNEQTIEQIEALTPTAADTNLEKLIEFFELEKYIHN
ncbi:hypothetical protein Riv7116_5476 [Rivularia sp. PCC 7116]|uniref:hypothetical protein n=1 Tax=Rivularia sp. PCC 7116 TaxID=373994 RepID=UPI00029F0CF4|nr:hypothetical protein [Rivularia sp. PCC 7116]AFY57848.1 hypothetical protein Riv7116_5476 [Rivularia sp. PCC 7116]